jgi:hypothetical protein
VLARFIAVNRNLSLLGKKKNRAETLMVEVFFFLLSLNVLCFHARVSDMKEESVQIVIHDEERIINF